MVEEVRRLRGQGRPVLIGTRSVDKSEELSRRLTAAGIEHQVLNARQTSRRRRSSPRPGEAGRVTIATNMAGRGTDIKLGPGVAAAGGLHVLGNGAARGAADRPAARRAAPAGRATPAAASSSCRWKTSCWNRLDRSRQAKLRARGQKGGNVDWQKYRGVFLRAQRKVERRHRRQRVDLMLYEKQRQELLKDLAADPYVD